MTYDDDSKGISYTAGFFMLICFCIAGAVLAQIIYKPIWYTLTDTDIMALADGNLSEKDTNAVRVVQAISAIVGFLLPTIVTAFVLNRRPLHLMGVGKRASGLQRLLVIGIMILALFVSAGLAYLNHLIPLPADWRSFFDKLERDYYNMVEAIVRLRNMNDYLVALLIMALIPAVCEEALFRGGLQNFLTRGTNKPWLSIIIVSLIFSLVHLSFYGFLSRFFLGVVLGLIFHYSGRLWLSILAHFFNNALALTMLYYTRGSEKNLEESISNSGDTWWGLLFTPLMIVAFMAFKRESDKVKATTGE